MANIAILCGGGEPPWSSTQGLIRAFKNLGHTVWTAGREYYGRNLADYHLPDRPHIEFYSYQEVLAECPFKPDLILNIDPGGYYSGEKPKNIPCAFFGTDAHRCGVLYQKVLRAGQFDYFFNAQPNYSEYFQEFNVVNTLPAFDALRFKKDRETKPECDIAFVGQSGLNFDEDSWKNLPSGQDECGRYIDRLDRWWRPDQSKYKFRNLPSFDYAERAELLYRLSQDFDVRIYGPIWDDRLQAALQKGRIGFNHSLLRDVGIRLFEYAASGRICVSDSLGFDISHFPAAFWYGGNSYRPFYQNFDLVYEKVKSTIGGTLNGKYRSDVEEDYRKSVFAHHTWEHRAQFMLERVGVS